MDNKEFRKIYLEIRDKIIDNFGKSEDNYPTVSWIAGIFRKTFDLPRIEHYLKTDLPQESKKYYEKILIVKNISEKYGLIEKIHNIKTNKINYRVTSEGSKFLQSLNKNINSWKHESLNNLSHKELKYTFLQSASEADREWFNSLDEKEKELVNKFRDLSPKEYFFLKGIKIAKDSKRSYTYKISILKINNPDAYSILSGLGFIHDNKINDGLVDSFFNFIEKYGYEHLKFFNRSLSYTSDRSAADKALNRNLLNRKLDPSSHRASEEGIKIRNFIQNHSNLENNVVLKAYINPNKLNKQEIQFLKSNDLFDGYELTDLGNAIGAILSRDKPLDTYTDEVPNGFPKDKLQRRGEIARGRKKSFKDFLMR